MIDVASGGAGQWLQAVCAEYSGGMVMLDTRGVTMAHPDAGR